MQGCLFYRKCTNYDLMQDPSTGSTDAGMDDVNATDIDNWPVMAVLVVVGGAVIAAGARL